MSASSYVGVRARGRWRPSEEGGCLARRVALVEVFADHAVDSRSVRGKTPIAIEDDQITVPFNWTPRFG
jgi:hypothetical protein